jgi:UrcA family protein
MKTRKLTSLFAQALGVTLVGLAPLCSLAGGDPSTPNLNRRVIFADLDLNSAQGVHILVERLKAASRLVCGVSDYDNPTTYHEDLACTEPTFARAVRNLNNSAVTRFYLDTHSAKVALKYDIHAEVRRVSR